jgi:hypothetical protein
LIQYHYPIGSALFIESQPLYYFGVLVIISQAFYFVLDFVIHSISELSLLGYFHPFTSAPLP